MKRVLLYCGLALLAARSASPAAADVLYERSLNASVSGAFSNAGHMEIARSFRLASDAGITGATWYGYYSGIDLDLATTPTVLFEVAFFSNDVDVPGTQRSRQTLSATAAYTGLDVTDSSALAGRKIYAFSAAVGPVSVTGGDVTWISIMEADDSLGGGSEWLWSHSSLGAPLLGTRGFLPGVNDWWEAGGPGNMALVLTGSVFQSDEPVVPLPGAALLGVLGLGAAGWRLRRVQA